MRILLANQDLTGQVTAAQSGTTIANVIQANYGEAEIINLPFDGKLSQIVQALHSWNGGDLVKFNYYGPAWETRQDDYLMTNLDYQKTAVIDASAFSNPELSQHYDNHDLFHASSYGLGQLILDAVTNEAQEIVLLQGATGMVDGGLGLLQALGAVVADESGDSIPVGENPLINFGQIDLAKATDLLAKVKFTILTADPTVFSGHQSSIVKSGEQLGLTKEQVVRLDVRAGSFNRMMRNAIGYDLSQMAGTGAGGGIAGALVCLNGELVADPFAWLFDKMKLAHFLEDFDAAILATAGIHQDFLNSYLGHLVLLCNEAHLPTGLLTLQRDLPVSELNLPAVSTMLLAPNANWQNNQDHAEIKPEVADLILSLENTSQEMMKLLVPRMI